MSQPLDAPPSNRVRPHAFVIRAPATSRAPCPGLGAGAPRPPRAPCRSWPYPRDWRSTNVDTPLIAADSGDQGLVDVDIAMIAGEQPSTVAIKGVFAWVPPRSAGGYLIKGSSVQPFCRLDQGVFSCLRRGRPPLLPPSWPPLSVVLRTPSPGRLPHRPPWSPGTDPP